MSNTRAFTLEFHDCMTKKEPLLVSGKIELEGLGSPHKVRTSNTDFFLQSI